MIICTPNKVIRKNSQYFKPVYSNMIKMYLFDRHLEQEIEDLIKININNSGSRKLTKINKLTIVYFGSSTYWRELICSQQQ